MTQLSYVLGSSTGPLIGETSGDNFDRIAAQYPEVPCFDSRHEGVCLAYAEMREAVKGRARASP